MAFIIIPLSLRCSPKALLVYGALYKHSSRTDTVRVSNSSTHSIAKFCKNHLNISRKQVYREVETLMNIGAITRTIDGFLLHHIPTKGAL